MTEVMLFFLYNNIISLLFLEAASHVSLALLI
jgi:hypothetical protein